ncbi:MAG: purine nucleoside permease [Gammaproteobacteria bacterium]|nr:MAG: purine nucleoside permease [Gammaproteobacteria bacterium]PCJ46888.1 MAG: purine nucleoside permease [Gammaproteobacteria bacterium]
MIIHNKIDSRSRFSLLILSIVFLLGLSLSTIKASPLEVKVVVVTMFEIGEDQGDAPGEFQHWRERQGLSKRFPFPQSHHDIFMNEKTGVLGIVTGMGTSRSSSAVMALGLDPRFDFTKAYWLVAGISGGDPENVSLGSAVWAEYLVDGDYAHEIDAREIPEDWSTGYFPLFSKGPYDPNKPTPQSEVFRLNPELANWAYELTKDIRLQDSAKLKAGREGYKGYPKALLPPFVEKGDHLAGMTFWHGKLLNDWANKWVAYWSDGKGEFMTSAMEDTGSYQSLAYLTKAGKADVNRFMVLRTVSNYTMPPAGVTAAESLIQDGEDYSGMDAALESAYLVGSSVVNTLVDNWDIYKDKIPGSTSKK